MKITIGIHRDERLEKMYLPIYTLVKNNKWSGPAIGATAALGGGLISPISGAVIDLLASFSGIGEERPHWSKASVFFFLAAISLLFPGSHFPDLLEKKTRRFRLSETRAAAQNIKPDSISLTLENTENLNLITGEN